MAGKPATPLCAVYSASFFSPYPKALETFNGENFDPLFDLFFSFSKITLSYVRLRLQFKNYYLDLPTNAATPLFLSKIVMAFENAQILNC